MTWPHVYKENEYTGKKRELPERYTEKEQGTRKNERTKEKDKEKKHNRNQSLEHKVVTEAFAQLAK